MKYFILILLILAGCKSTPPATDSVADEFKNLRGCFLLYNLKTDKLVKQYGESCYESFPACSTFKVPLAVMAFDSGVLKNEEQILKWDGKKRWLDHWNKDQNARTWMQYSVVWFSQELTPKIGEEKLKSYLDKLDYGNKDLSAGIRDAWLVSPGLKSSALKISPMEQLEFMKKLWRNKLPVSERSMNLTKEIMELEKSPKGFQLSGKTGSNFYDDQKKFQLGWFIAHLKNGNEEYIAITNISDLAPYEGASFGGMRAKDITKKIFASEGLW